MGSPAAPPAALAGASVAAEASVLAPVALSLPAAELSVGLAALVFVVELVEVVCAEAASALVFVGGVMSGVLLGTESVTCAVLPPQAASVTPHSTAAQAASAGLVLTAVPYACRTWGSR